MRGTCISFILMLFFLALSCSDDGTGPEGGSLVSGTVTINGSTDHSGVTVSFFPVNEQDSILSNYYSKHPQVGVDPESAVLLDHTIAQAAVSATTDSDGNWKVELSQNQPYHIVFQKDGLGWRYFLNQQDFSSKINVSMSPAVRITSGTISDARVFSGDFISLEGNVLVESGGSLTFDGINYLSFNGNNQLIVQGTITMNNGAELRIFNASTVSNVSGKFSIENNNALNLNNIFSFDNTEVRISNSEGTIANSVFKNANGASLRLRAFSGILRNSLLFDSQRGTVIDQSSGVTLRACVFYSNESDVEAITAGSINVVGNIFRNSDVNVDFISVGGLIKNNEFNNATLNISIADISSVRVLSNNFLNSQKNIENFQISHQGNDTEIIAHTNNFLNTDQFVIDITLGIKDSLLASQNYWNAANIFEIENLIQDGRDFPGSNIKLVSYVPFETSRIDTVGVQ